MLGRNWGRRVGVGKGCCESFMAIGVTCMWD